MGGYFAPFRMPCFQQREIPFLTPSTIKVMKLTKQWEGKKGLEKVAFHFFNLQTIKELWQLCATGPSEHTAANAENKEMIELQVECSLKTGHFGFDLQSAKAVPTALVGPFKGPEYNIYKAKATHQYLSSSYSISSSSPQSSE